MLEFKLLFYYLLSSLSLCPHSSNSPSGKLKYYLEINLDLFMVLIVYNFE